MIYKIYHILKFMDTMKRFAKYLILLIVFWIFSDILINVSINSIYKDIEPQNPLSSQISISRAEATSVNGRINGVVTNNTDNNISGKYLKVDLYSSTGNLLGTKFLDIGTVGDNESRSFETYFKFQNVKAYDVTIVDEKTDEVSSESFMTEDMTNFAVLLLLTYMIFV